MRRQAEARRQVVTDFTRTIDALIDANRLTEASSLISEFNDEYPAIAGDDKALTEYVRSLIAKASANKAL